MKCLILAGGKGNSVWPLSREEYPKQFMQIKEKRSLLQETVARNIPFCDEFIIITNESYHFIVEGQMKAFQGLKYRCILEKVGRKTAPAIAIACMGLNPSELAYVVSADQIIEGEDYKGSLMEARKIAKEGKIVIFGMKALSAHTGYGYIHHAGNQVLEFKEKPGQELAEQYYQNGQYLWNSGNCLFCVGDFLNELRKCSIAIYEACGRIAKQVHLGDKSVELNYDMLIQVPACSIENAVFEKSEKMYVIQASFRWWDIGNMSILSSYMKENEGSYVIQENCDNVTVVNQAEGRLLVTNGLKDATVVATKDVTYVVGNEQPMDVKQLVQKYQGDYGGYFEKSTVVYRPWGTYEILTYAPNYKVKKVTVYPGEALTKHRHAMRSEQWSIMKGTATVTLGSETQKYSGYHTVSVPIGVDHQLANTEEEDLILIEVSMGPQVTEADTERIESIPVRLELHNQKELVKCEPVFKDYLWGGTKLRDVYKKNCDYDIIAESWELSAHEAGQCSIAEGKYQGMLFGDYLKLLGESALGWKCQAFEKFPLLIKLIDAKERLSIQVHPDDEFALPVENEYGKNEMWYIMECEEGASIYYGVKRSITKQELQERITQNTVLEVLQEVKVQKGDTFFVKSGTIHAIGAGIVICEIQQNSNCTYRLYDYDRRDKFGNLRELHLDKALEVAALEPVGETLYNTQKCYECKTYQGYAEQMLGECKYFVSVLYQLQSAMELYVDDTSFCSILILEGSGEIQKDAQCMKYKAGDSFFAPAGSEKIKISGKSTLIVTHV